MKLKLEIEVEFDPESMHGNEPDSIEWFRDQVLLNTDPDQGLSLHSNCLGDFVGDGCRVIQILSPLVDKQPLIQDQDYEPN